MLANASGSHRSRLVVAVVAIVLGAAGGGALYLLLRENDQPARRVPAIGEDRSIKLDTGGALLLGGELVSLDEASQLAGFAALRPDDSANMATDASIAEVWVTTDGQATIALKYDSGMTVILTQWPKGNPETPESFYKSLAQQSGVGTVETFNGNPAWVVPADAQGPGRPDVSTIVMAVGSIEMSLKADMPLEELREVALSVKGTAAA